MTKEQEKELERIAYARELIDQFEKLVKENPEADTSDLRQKIAANFWQA